MNHADADGTLHTEDGLTVLRFERHLAHPAGKVWHALTDTEALRALVSPGRDGGPAPGREDAVHLPGERGLRGNPAVRG